VKPQLGVCQIGAWTETRNFQNGQPYNPPRISREFSGRIDEVMIFDRPLAEKEIAALHALGKP
jgi:hypothetical protein